VTTVDVPSGRNLLQVANIDKGRIGAEFNAAAKISSSLTAAANYLLQENNSREYRGGHYQHEPL
jgi:hypothetical protein